MRKKLPLIRFDCPALSKCLFHVMVLSASILTTTVVTAQSVFLKDLNERESTDVNEFSSLVSGHDKAYYISRGKELWTSYLGTDDQEVGLKLGSYQAVSNLIMVGNTLYFTATTESGNELYKSNGTVGGTVLVKDIYAGAGSSNPAFLVDVNGTLYFSATNGTHGKELWKSNGTAAGTVMVKDIFAKAGSSNPSHLTNVNGVVFFAANDGTNGYEVWKSNGTLEGTVLVKDIRTGSKVSSTPDKFENVNGTLFFTANESATGRELYKSDGTATGTMLVKDIRPGTGSSLIDNLAAIGNTLYFTANDGVYGDELWKSDGTTIGTVLVKDMTPGPAGSHGEQSGGHRMGSFTNVNGTLFFTAYEKATQYIWKSDGTTAGTVPLEIAYGPGTGEPSPQFQFMNGSIYYFNSYPEDSWTSTLKRMNPDGSNPGWVWDIYLNTNYRTELVVVQDYTGAKHLYFYGIALFAGYKLFRSNGLEDDWEGTVELPDPYVPTASSNPNTFKVFKGKTYFIANPTWYDNQSLWVTDGTANGTQEVIYFSYNGGDFSFSDNYVYAAGKDWLEIYRSGEGLWNYGYIIEDYNAPPAKELTAVSANMFYRNDNGELYKIDDVSGEVTLLRQFDELYDLEKVGSNLIFRVRGLNYREELWRSNGTATGTIRYTTLSNTFQTPSVYRPSATIRNTHYFVANDGVHGNELWRTQGSASSTYMIADLNVNDHLFTSNNKENDIRSMTVFRDSLYFSAVDNSGTWSLFKTNGIATGIRNVTPMNQVVEMVPAGNKLYLFSINSQNSAVLNLYVTNGTANGTTLLTEVPSDRVSYEVINNELYYMPYGISEVWKTDGTVCGTVALGLGAQANFGIGKVGNQLIFSGFDVDKGYEPFVYNTINAPDGSCGDQLVANNFSNAELFALEQEPSSVYPNPFQNEMVLRINGSDNVDAHVQVFTTSGVQVEGFENLKVNTDYSIGGAWPLGMYVIKINAGGKISSQKVVKRR
jgi:ELWxxDGT repeat protein